MLIEWLWTFITGVGFLVCGWNAIRARRTVTAVKADPESRPAAEKMLLLSMAYGHLMRQMGMMLAVGFNMGAGILVLTVPVSPVRGDVAVALLMSSAFTLTLLSMMEAVRDE